MVRASHSQKITVRKRIGFTWLRMAESEAGREERLARRRARDRLRRAQETPAPEERDAR